MRNHNSHDQTDQEIYSMGETLLQAGKKALKLRYGFLK